MLMNFIAECINISRHAALPSLAWPDHLRADIVYRRAIDARRMAAKHRLADIMPAQMTLAAQISMAKKPCDTIVIFAEMGAGHRNRRAPAKAAMRRQLYHFAELSIISQ